MKKRIYPSSLFYLFSLVFAASFVQAQTTLVEEDFNACTYPSDWTVNIIGNQNAVWYIGEPINPNSDSTSIDGTCMLVVDDDATGDNTPDFTAQFITPVFDATLHSTINFSVDVSFRQLEESYFRILVFDGTSYQEVRRFQYAQGSTGNQFSEFVTVTADLSFYANPNMQVMFEYDDGSTWAWYAGFDNVRITGVGTATNLITETFNSCSMPTGWSVSHTSGSDDWQFGHLSNPNASDTTMDSSCMLFFDDDILGNANPPSTSFVTSPFFDGTLYANYYLDFDFIFRQYQDIESVSVYVYDGTTNQLTQAYLEPVGGPQVSTYEHQTVDLSSFRSPQMAIAFAYADGGSWGWWTAIDNFKVSGEGEINDFCTKANSLLLDAPCQSAANTNALFTEASPSCSAEGNVGSLWYEYKALNSGWVEIQTEASFNDVISVFTGNCTNLTPQFCTNKDEHGFRGEHLRFNAVDGTTYRIRVNGLDNQFGLARGTVCMRIVSSSPPPSPPNNNTCASAIPLMIDDACVAGTNYHSTSSTTIPSRDAYARSDIWYQINANSSDLEIITNADFADVITVYSGTCGVLTEVASNELGCRLALENLTINQTYFIQVAGAFATIEGNVCMEVQSRNPVVPSNDDCSNAPLLTLGAACTTATIDHATVDGIEPSCEIFDGGNIWYRFVAPASGGVRFNTNADFQHSVAIYEGNTCTNLEEVFCTKNPLRCDGKMDVVDLIPTQMYYLQITTPQNQAHLVEGDFCLEIEDITTPYMEMPLDVQVNVNCTGEGTAQLMINVVGGSGNYTMQGETESDVLSIGYQYVIVATDNVTGCEQSITGMIDCGASACPPSLTLGDIETATTQYETSGTIISDQVIEATADIIYDAGTTIELNAGFETKLGAVFHAYIEGCGTTNMVEENAER